MFIHLDVHTEYSLLNSIFKLEDIRTACLNNQLPGIAVNDFNTLFKPFTIQKIFNRKPNIAHSIGCKFLVKGKYLDSFYTLLLYPKTYQGYLNLVKLSTIANSGQKEFAHLTYEDIEQYKNDLICLSGGNTGELFHLILEENEVEAENFAFYLQKIFGIDNFYYELQNHYIKDEEKVNYSDLLRKIIRALKIPTVATSEVFYWKKEHAEHRDIGYGMNPNPEGIEYMARYVMYNHEFYLKSEDEINEAFKDLLPIFPDCLKNTVKIFNQIKDVEIKTQKVLPEFPIPSGYTNETYFDHLVDEGFKKRLALHQFDDNISIDIYKERLEYEKRIIKQMGFIDYHMIVQDFINWAKDSEVRHHPEVYFPEAYFPDLSIIDPECTTEKDFSIIVGPGRGSAAGSLVCYCLSITDIDPIANKLLFERFLNPERVSMPDIDVDLPNKDRYLVVKYLQNKYGMEKVSQIATFQTLGVKSIIKNVGKKLGIPYTTTDLLTKNVPSSIVVEKQNEDGTYELVEKPVETISELENVEFFAEKISEDEDLKELFRYGKVLEGLPISTGKHAAGCIVCRVPIDSFVPLMEVDGIMVTQFEKHDAEDIGLLKIDLLGLLNLDIIGKTFDLINSEYGEELSLASIPNNDQKTFELFQRGDTGNVFQFEGMGMKNLLKKIHPTNTEHLNAACALYRPGPMQFIDIYLQGRQNPSDIKYPHESFEEVTKDTYGILVYQEQVMQLVQKMAGFTLGEADILRRGIGKKEEKLILENRKKFVEGGIKTSHLSESLLNEIYDTICKFASYGFNRSHSCAYSWISYICGYLKANYPYCYMIANLSLYSENNNKLASTLVETKKMGMKLLPPDIRYSKHDFSLEFKDDKPCIRYSFEGIKGIGEEVANALENMDRYDTFYEYMTHMPSKILRSDKMKDLIYAGVFDCFGTRRGLCASIDKSIDSIKEISKLRDSLLSDFTDQLVYPEVEDLFEFPLDEKIDFQKKRLQISLSGHPIDAIRNMYDFPYTIGNIEDVLYDDKLKDEPQKMLVILKSIRIIKTKKKHEDMAFIQIEDEFSDMEAVVFPKDYTKCKKYLNEGEAAIVTGTIQDKDNKLSFIIERVEPVEKESSIFYIKGSYKAKSFIRRLAQFNGITPVICVNTSKNSKKRVQVMDFRINYSRELVDYLHENGLKNMKDYVYVNPYKDAKPSKEV